MSSLKEAPKEIYNFYLQTASNIVANVDESLQQKMLEDLTKTIETSCKLDAKLKQSYEILSRLSETENNCNEDEEAHENQEILEQFKNEIAGINTDTSKNKKFLDFKQQVKVFLDEAKPKTNDDEDDELVLTQKEINVIDPITKKRIIDPVRNTACGHVYDRESVKALLKGNKRTRCPVVGCANKHYVQMKDLETDIITKRYLDRNVE